MTCAPIAFGKRFRHYPSHISVTLSFTCQCVREHRSICLITFKKGDQFFYFFIFYFRTFFLSSLSKKKCVPLRFSSFDYSSIWFSSFHYSSPTCVTKIYLYSIITYSSHAGIEVTDSNKSLLPLERMRPVPIEFINLPHP